MRVPGGTQGFLLRHEPLLRGVDTILVPLLPSSIDIRAGARFINQLHAHRSYRLNPVPVGVIANRVRQNTTTHAKLLQFLDRINVPTVATFRDSALYTRLAEEGTGIFDDVADAAAEREALEWSRLLHWIDEVTSHRDGVHQLSPLAAPPHYRNAESAEA